MTMLNTLLRAAILGAVLLAIVAPSTLAAPAANNASAKKLYRWVGADGKVHYSDQIPPEAMDQARQELSAKSGLAVGQVERALTDKERAAAAAKAAADAKAAAALANAKQSDQVLLASYPSEAELKRAYDERVALQAETVKASRIGIKNQQQTLSSQLIRASNLELNGKPVNTELAAAIQLARKQLLNQQALLVQHIAEGQKMQDEYRSTLERYRSLQSPAPSAPQPQPTPGVVPKG